MNPDADPEPALSRETPPGDPANRWNSATADAALEFGHFHVLLRQRQLFADGAPVELGTRAFDLLMALLVDGF